MLKAARNSFTVPEPAAFHLHDNCARHSTRSFLFTSSLNRSACCGVCVTHAGRPKGAIGVHRASHKKAPLTATSRGTPRTLLPRNKSVRSCARDTLTIMITTGPGEDGSRIKHTAQSESGLF